MPMFIAGFQKTSLLDYPEKIACIVFTNGCNFRCGYCHNPELFEAKEPVLTVPAFFEFLNTRHGKLDGVVITGGEPTLQKDLFEFIKQIKSMGFCVKLDTNGSNYQILNSLISENLLDYIAMDIKAPFGKYAQITGMKENFAEAELFNIKKSINLIMNSGIDYEFRTTVVKSQLSYSDFDKIGKMIKGAKKYYLQKFVPSKILDKRLSNEKTYSNFEMNEICTKLKHYVGFAGYR